jgi:hypothetical protein
VGLGAIEALTPISAGYGAVTHRLSLFEPLSLFDPLMVGYGA